MLSKEREVNYQIAGKEFVLTGALQTLTREQATSAILQRGGRVESKVTRSTDYLIYGKLPAVYANSRKLTSARKYGTQLRKEDWLLAAILVTEPEFVPRKTGVVTSHALQATSDLKGRSVSRKKRKIVI